MLALMDCNGASPFGYSLTECRQPSYPVGNSGKLSMLLTSVVKCCNAVAGSEGDQELRLRVEGEEGGVNGEGQKNIDGAAQDWA